MQRPSARDTTTSSRASPASAATWGADGLVRISARGGSLEAWGGGGGRGWGWGEGAPAADDLGAGGLVATAHDGQAAHGGAQSRRAVRIQSAEEGGEAAGLRRQVQSVGGGEQQVGDRVERVQARVGALGARAALGADQQRGSDAGNQDGGRALVGATEVRNAEERLAPQRRVFTT